MTKVQVKRVRVVAAEEKKPEDIGLKPKFYLSALPKVDTKSLLSHITESVGHCVGDLGSTLIINMGPLVSGDDLNRLRDALTKQLKLIEKKTTNMGKDLAEEVSNRMNTIKI